MKFSFKYFTVAAVLSMLGIQAYAVTTNFDNISLDGQGTTPYIRFDLPNISSKYIVGFNNNMAFYPGSSYAVRFYQDAPSSSLIVRNPGVGMGTANPEATLHIRKSLSNAQVRVEDAQNTTAVKTLLNLICESCTPGFRLHKVSPDNQAWFFRMLQNGNFSVDDPSTLTKEAEFRSGGNLVIGGTLTESSSRTVKKNIIEVDNVAVLNKLDDLRINHWTYIHETDGVRHMGPMAEDFHAAFKLGDTDKGIASVDTSGVALAAIKGLHNKLKAKESRVEALEQQVNEMKQEFAQLRQDNELLVKLLQYQGTNGEFVNVKHSQ